MSCFHFWTSLRSRAGTVLVAEGLSSAVYHNQIKMLICKLNQHFEIKIFFQIKLHQKHVVWDQTNTFESKPLDIGAVKLVKLVIIHKLPKFCTNVFLPTEQSRYLLSVTVCKICHTIPHYSIKKLQKEQHFDYFSSRSFIKTTTVYTAISDYNAY